MQNKSEEKTKIEKKTKKTLRSRKKPINYKVENEKLKTELERLKQSVQLDFNKKIPVDLNIYDLIWIKRIIGNEMVNIQQYINELGYDDKLPIKEGSIDYLLSEKKTLESIYNKINCLIF